MNKTCNLRCITSYTQKGRLCKSQAFIQGVSGETSHWTLSETRLLSISGDHTLLKFILSCQCAALFTECDTPWLSLFCRFYDKRSRYWSTSRALGVYADEEKKMKLRNISHQQEASQQETSQARRPLPCGPPRQQPHPSETEQRNCCVRDGV